MQPAVEWVQSWKPVVKVSLSWLGQVAKGFAECRCLLTGCMNSSDQQFTKRARAQDPGATRAGGSQLQVCAAQDQHSSECLVQYLGPGKLGHLYRDSRGGPITVTLKSKKMNFSCMGKINYIWFSCKTITLA